MKGGRLVALLAVCLHSGGRKGRRNHIPGMRTAGRIQGRILSLPKREGLIVVGMMRLEILEMRAERDIQSWPMCSRNVV